MYVTFNITFAVISKYDTNCVHKLRIYLEPELSCGSYLSVQLNGS